MFGKKESRAITDRLTAIKNTPPVQFSELHREVRARRSKVDRETARRPAYKIGMVMTPAGEDISCVVRDISEAGARVVLEGAIGLPPEFKLVIEGYSAPTHVALAWQKENEAGISFV